MRRIVYWLLGTVTVLVLLFGYRTSLAGPLAASKGTVASAPPSTAGASPGNSGSSGNSGSGTTGQSQSSTGSPSRTVAGPVVKTRWGPVQVQVTASGGKLSDVSVLQYPNGNPRDQQINDYALPILIQESLDAQSANIDMVSGATVTSDGYLQSLQGALDEAGL
ncbi:MAG TPA: FMN-binding protein [Actinomycetes bacterium]|nr:FMN-binding protein [Actinomycetes bacterium]